jgi:hypothetical protein
VKKKNALIIVDKKVSRNINLIGVCKREGFCECDKDYYGAAC